MQEDFLTIHSVIKNKKKLIQAKVDHQTSNMYNVHTAEIRDLQ